MHYFVTIRQRNIRKRNQSFGYANRFRFIFGLKTSFEMSETQQRCSSDEFIKYRIKLSYYVSNLPFVTEGNQQCFP